DSLTVAFGDSADLHPPHVVDVSQFHDLFYAFPSLRSGHPANLGHEVQVGLDRHLGVQGHGLGKIANTASHFQRFGEDVVAVYRRGSRRRGKNPAKNAHGRGFSGAIWSEEPENLARLNV